MSFAPVRLHRTRSSRRLRYLLAAAVVTAVIATTGCTAVAPAASPSPTAPAAEGGVDDAAMQAALDDTLAEGGFPGVIARVITPEGTWTGVAGTRGPDDT